MVGCEICICTIVWYWNLCLYPCASALCDIWLWILKSSNSNVRSWCYNAVWALYISILFNSSSNQLLFKAMILGTVVHSNYRHGRHQEYWYARFHSLHNSNGRSGKAYVFQFHKKVYEWNLTVQVTAIPCLSVETHVFKKCLFLEVPMRKVHREILVEKWPPVCSWHICCCTLWLILQHIYHVPYHFTDSGETFRDWRCYIYATTGKWNFSVCMSNFLWALFQHTRKLYFPCWFLENSQESTKIQTEIHIFSVEWVMLNHSIPLQSTLFHVNPLETKPKRWNNYEIIINNIHSLLDCYQDSSLRGVLLKDQSFCIILFTRLIVNKIIAYKYPDTSLSSGLRCSNHQCWISTD